MAVGANSLGRDASVPRISIWTSADCTLTQTPRCGARCRKTGNRWRQILKVPTSSSSDDAIRERSAAAIWVCCAPALVSLAALATAEMFAAISWVADAASFMLRPISLVAAACSSTALAMVVW